MLLRAARRAPAASRAPASDSTGSGPRQLAQEADHLRGRMRCVLRLSVRRAQVEAVSAGTGLAPRRRRDGATKSIYRRLARDRLTCGPHAHFAGHAGPTSMRTARADQHWLGAGGRGAHNASRKVAIRGWIRVLQRVPNKLQCRPDRCGASDWQRFSGDTSSIAIWGAANAASVVSPTAGLPAATAMPRCCRHVRARSPVEAAGSDRHGDAVELEKFQHGLAHDPRNQRHQRFALAARHGDGFRSPECRPARCRGPRQNQASRAVSMARTRMVEESGRRTWRSLVARPADPPGRWLRAVHTIRR